MTEEDQNNAYLDSFLSKTLYFFPVQLFLAHFKRNTLLVLVWALVFLLITRNLGESFGVPFLLLYPEYLGDVGFTSHLILGFASGGLIMAFNISGYILNSYNFPFMATLARPFFKYSLNNFVIPVTFFVVYIYHLVVFQHYEQLESYRNIMIHILGFIAGNIVFIVISLFYFFSTSKSIFELLHLTDHAQHQKKSRSLARSFMIRFDNMNKHMMREGEFRVDRYLNDFTKISLARDTAHYDKHMMSMVYAQNHINASVFEFMVIFTIVLLGVFRDFEPFQIPAGASVLLLFSMTLMIFSAIYSWFKKWSTLIIVAFIVLVSTFSTKNIQNLNKPFGLKYKEDRPAYNAEHILRLQQDTQAILRDKFHHLNILNHWHLKNPNDSLGQKPKIIFINTSGGGLRAALWSYYSLAYLDSFLGPNFTNKIHLISGASGGMFGAAYFRELYLQRQTNPKIHIRSKKYLENISKDLLNPIGYTITVHDLFFSLDDILGNDNIVKDRAYAFEKQFHKNTDSVLNKPLFEYMSPEFEAKIPMMILHPTIVNDFRKLYISAQPISFMMSKQAGSNLNTQFSVENIEFTKFFKGNDPYQLAFSSALRMSGTFPYVLPNVSLPSDPIIEVMDAGVRDNYGMETTLSYMMHFKEWIAENTSGVIIIQLRDKFKINPDDTLFMPDFKQNVSPFGAILGNVTTSHNYIQDNMLLYLAPSLDFPVDVINLELLNLRNDKISLSWHLTKKEKNKILKSMNIVSNEQAIYRLTALLNPRDSLMKSDK